jgi:hypothetical protein
MFVVVHGIDVGPPAYIQPKTSPVLARATTSESARILLDDPNSEFYFEKLCTCSAEEKAEGVAKNRAATDLVYDEAELDIDTVKGFALGAQEILLRMGDGTLTTLEDDDEEDEEFAIERRVIEGMITNTGS